VKQLSNYKQNTNMKSTTIQIDHREWKEWRDESPEGAIGKMNILLKKHGVIIEVLNGSESDYLELRAVSIPPVYLINP